MTDYSCFRNYRYEFVPDLGGGGPSTTVSGRTMARWILVACSLTTLLVLSVSFGLSGSGSAVVPPPAEETLKTLSAEGTMFS